MKTFTSLFFALLFAGVLSAQTVYINSPESLQGAYTFSAAAFGGDINADIWTADAVFVDDGSANPNQGCNAAVNGAELAGKIALIDRGSCEFGIKCLNAEQAGAIAAIVFNNAAGAGAIVMGAGVNGGAVTIPCVMLSYEDGQAIRAALANGAVNISIGALVFPNDLRLTANNVLNAPLGIVPFAQVKAAGDFIFTPGATALNAGSNDAQNLSVNAVIEYAPFGGSNTEVYNESGSLPGTILSDSTSELVVLPPFEPSYTSSGADMGIYTVTYSVASDSTEDVGSDNQVSSSFAVSEHLYSKASLNPTTGDPRTTILRTISGGGDIEFTTVLNIPYGFGYRIDSVIFTMSISSQSAPNLANVPVEAYVYEWNDLNQDSSINNDEVAIAGIATYTFPEDATATQATLRLPFLDFFTFEETGVVIPEDNKDYIIGIRYQGANIVFFGFDDSYDYLEYLNLQAATGALTDRDYGYLGINAWNDLVPDFEAAFQFTGTRTASSTGVVLGQIPDATEDIVGPETFEVKMFPNPTSDVLQLNLNMKQQASFVEYTITDMMGKELFKTRDNDVMETEQASFNVSQLPAGQYNIAIRTEQGVRASSFVVKR
ncbi:MAG: T9SS type A sorting domain-containing protein [Lewinellaceae bacterium]|nr:T9SS type A sorting domain-containing protein [Lewinellaceae bacterium]